MALAFSDYQSQVAEHQTMFAISASFAAGLVQSELPPGESLFGHPFAAGRFAGN